MDEAGGESRVAWRGGGRANTEIYEEKASDQRYQLGDGRRSPLGCLRGREFVKGPVDHRDCFHVLVVNLFGHLG